MKQSTTSRNKTELLRNRILNRLSEESGLTPRSSHNEEPKSFKIKTLHNFHILPSASNPKLRQANSPIGTQPDLVTEKSTQKSGMLTSRDTDRSEMLFMQEMKRADPNHQLEKFLKNSTNITPSPAVKIALNTKPSERGNQNIANIPTRQSIPQRQAFEHNSTINTSMKMVSPRNKNIILLPAKQGASQTKPVTKVTISNNAHRFYVF